MMPMFQRAHRKMDSLCQKENTTWQMQDILLSRSFLTPYRGVRYHLNEFARQKIDSTSTRIVKNYSIFAMHRYATILLKRIFGGFEASIQDLNNLSPEYSSLQLKRVVMPLVNILCFIVVYFTLQRSKLIQRDFVYICLYVMYGKID